MKKLMFFISFLVLLVACEKPEPPAPPLVTYTISVSITGKGEVTPDKVAVVFLGESKTLAITSETGWVIYSVKVNSIVYEVPALSTSYSCAITGINTNQYVFVVFVKAADVLVSKDKWYLWVRENQYVDGGPWYVQNFSPSDYTNYMIFTIEGKLSEYHSDGVIFGGPYSWVITAETLTIVNGIVYTIKFLDSTKMILEHDVYGTDGGHFHARETYYHTPKS